MRSFVLFALQLSFVCSPFSAAAAQSMAPSHVDPTCDAMREEDFLRGIADLGLNRVLADLEITEPAAAATDAATPFIRAIAVWRMMLIGTASNHAMRVDALARLRHARTGLFAALPKDPRQIIWMTDAAEDELRFGFLGLDGGAEAIAGSPTIDAAQRASASLARIRDLLERATTAEGALTSASVPIGSALAHRLDDDARARRPFLAAAARALALAIHRTAHDPTVERERPIEAAALLKTLSEIRSALPSRLRPEADLAEVAAAAVAVDPEAARFASSRVMRGNDVVMTVLARILLADGLVRQRRGVEALQQLNALAETDTLPTAMQLLIADALVRMRIYLGKSPSDEVTLNLWIAALTSAPRDQVAGVRRAVLERIAGVLRGAPVFGTLPPLAVIAQARDQLLADPSSAAQIVTLEELAKQVSDRQAQAAAIVVLAEVHSTAGAWGLAAADYRRFANEFDEDPAALDAISAALDIELALDKASPDDRIDALEATLSLALNRFAELPTRARSAAQLEALTMRRNVAQFLLRPRWGSVADAAAFATAAEKLEALSATALQSGFDPGSRVTAAITMARIVADFPPSGATIAVTEIAPPTAAAWQQWSSHDAQRILQVRIERASVAPDARSLAIQRELRDLPHFLVEGAPSIAQECIVRSMLRNCEAARAAGATEPSAAAAAQCALDAALACEAVLQSGRTTDAQQTSREFDRLAADAAAFAQQWDAALLRAQRIASADGATTDDWRRLTEVLDAAQHAAVGTPHESTRGALQTRAMEAARELAARANEGSRAWWIAQVIQLGIAHETGRTGERMQARIARLRAMDPLLGGEPFGGMIDGFTTTSITPPSAPQAN
ncbi:MAG: hypothetical protein EXS15_01420 [Phycisphaerales bacterium]|nr:hypothetical protein [Phycisphaerales bacterium]